MAPREPDIKVPRASCHRLEPVSPSEVAHLLLGTPLTQQGPLSQIGHPQSHCTRDMQHSDTLRVVIQQTCISTAINLDLRCRRLTALEEDLGSGVWEVLCLKLQAFRPLLPRFELHVVVLEQVHHDGLDLLRSKEASVCTRGVSRSNELKKDDIAEGLTQDRRAGRSRKPY